MGENLPQKAFETTRPTISLFVSLVAIAAILFAKYNQEYTIRLPVQATLDGKIGRRESKEGLLLGSVKSWGFLRRFEESLTADARTRRKK
jgi:hypothetical protein